MAATLSSHPLLPRHQFRRTSSPKAAVSPTDLRPHDPAGGRRHCLFLLTATTALKALELPSTAAETIPFFGIRKKLKKAEEATEAVVKEGFEAAEKGLQAAETEIESAEKGIEAAAADVDPALQAGAVAGAEFLGVVVATSIVNGILAPES